ncbi:hypothetical protein FQN54_004944 [Arachnomyces sp. PD_36]|nr:hypothetical protein FQN54_004944 [Arachnomyces sp. PD_36]
MRFLQAFLSTVFVVSTATALASPSDCNTLAQLEDAHAQILSKSDVLTAEASNPSSSATTEYKAPFEQKLPQLHLLLHRIQNSINSWHVEGPEQASTRDEISSLVDQIRTKLDQQQSVPKDDSSSNAQVDNTPDALTAVNRALSVVQRSKNRLHATIENTCLSKKRQDDLSLVSALLESVDQLLFATLDLVGLGHLKPTAIGHLYTALLYFLDDIVRLSSSLSLLR